MTTLERPTILPVTPPRNPRKGSVLADWLSTTDHKIIGHLYLITSFGFFLAAGVINGTLADLKQDERRGSATCPFNCAIRSCRSSRRSPSTSR